MNLKEKIEIIDASVAIKWFVAEENGSLAARDLLLEVRDNPKKFAVPELFFLEMFSVLWRVFRDPTSLSKSMQLLEDLGLHRVGHGRELFARSAEICGRYDMSGFDAIYVATASLCGGVWVTADERAHRSILGSGLSRCL